MSKDIIITDVRNGVGMLDEAFDPELLIQINVASYDLFQNGVILNPTVTKDTTWEDLKCDPSDLEQIKSYFTIHSKLMVDSPQPSMVATYNSMLSKILDRLHFQRYRKPDKEVSE